MPDETKPGLKFPLKPEPAPEEAESAVIPEVPPKEAAPKVESEVIPAAPVVKPKARVKPLLEGINAPKNTNTSDIAFAKANMLGGPALPATPKATLTNEEKDLISKTADFNGEHPRPLVNPLMPGGLKKTTNGKAWVVIALIILLLAVGGYAFYTGVFNSKNVPLTNNDSSQNSNPSPINTNPEGASTTTPAIVATSTPDTASSTPVAAPVLKLKVTSTPTAFLNVRTLPSLSGKIITKVHPDETYIYTKTQNGWYYITLNDGSFGWVIGQYVTVIK